MKKGFRMLEHPADMGIEAFGPDLRDAFGEAARALISIVVDPATVDERQSRIVSLEGADLENLLVRWLSEVLYQYDAEKFLTAQVAIDELTPTRLHAVLKGEMVDGKKHQLRTDVKAITYHQIRVEEQNDGCVVRVFLDI